MHQPNDVRCENINLCRKLTVNFYLSFLFYAHHHHRLFCRPKMSPKTHNASITTLNLIHKMAGETLPRCEIPTKTLEDHFSNCLQCFVKLLPKNRMHKKDYKSNPHLFNFALILAKCLILTIDQVRMSAILKIEGEFQILMFNCFPWEKFFFFLFFGLITFLMGS